MNFRKLITYLTMGTAAAMPLAVAQNPTILQGSYISNVFGQSNFILNPNAQTNIANVTVSNATVTRSTTTPLVATSEFNITTSTATGYADWATRTFDAGMKNQNCEARFTYRGFSVGSTSIQVRQGSNTVAQLTLTASTDPRIASINFPCGDLSSATTLRVQQATASLTGTNEIGGLYLGLATNQANVAQAENVVQAARNTAQSITGSSPTAIIFSTETKDAYGEFDTSNGRFTAKRAGDYLINSAVLFEDAAWTAGQYIEITIRKNANVVCRDYKEIQASITMFLGHVINCTITLSVGDYVETFVEQNRGTTSTNSSSGYTFTNISRFPTSSELVVTPERQNVFGAVTSTQGNTSVGITSSSYTAFNNATNYSSMSYSGKATALQTGVCGTTNDAGLCMPTMPPGTYKVTVTTPMFTQNGAGTLCFFSISDGTTDTPAGRSYQALANEENSLATLSGTFTYTSVQTNKAFRLVAKRLLGGGSCFNVINQTDGAKFTMVVEPLDQPSNSALYVQGPVLGSQTGAAVSAGYVGELRQNNTSGCGTNAQINDGASITITPGIWRVMVSANIDMGTGVLTDWLVFVGPQSGNVSTWRQSYHNDSWFTNASSTTFRKQPITPPIQYVRYDGTNLYRFENNAWTSSYASASGTLYAKFYRDTSIVPTQCYTNIVAERVN